jgi:ubiquinone/menaquinone biosynthesis C-methylase UbiE
MAAYLRFRERFRKPEETLAKIGITEGQRLLDFGCGIGSYSIPAAKIVGEEGKVYALDVHPLAIENVRKRIAKEGLPNVETIISGLETGVDDESLDHVLLLDVYSWISTRVKLLKELHRVLKPGGKLSVLIDHMDPAEFVGDIERTNLFVVDLQDDNFFILSNK